MLAHVVVKLEEDGSGSVLVNQDGERLTEEEEKWLAYLALPVLGRFAFATEGAYQRYHEAIVGAKRV